MILSRAYLGTQDFMVNRALGLFAWIVPLGFRLIIAPFVIASGWYKFENQEQTLQWFGSMAVPEPEIMLQLVIWSEIVGGLLLLIGFATRWATIPLMVIMVVAAVKVHGQHGWYEVLPTEPQRSPSRIFHEAGIPQGKQSMQNIDEANIRLKRAQVVLRDNTDYQWLTAKGGLVVHQSGVERPVTYFLMLFSLMFTGAGFFSIDWIINRRKRRQIDEWRQEKAYEAGFRDTPENEPMISNTAAVAAAGSAGASLSHADRIRIAREKTAQEPAEAGGEEGQEVDIADDDEEQLDDTSADEAAADDDSIDELLSSLDDDLEDNDDTDRPR